MLLADVEGPALLDAVLRAGVGAGTAANAGVGDGEAVTIAAVGGTAARERERATIDGACSKVKELELPVVEDKRLEHIAGVFWIDVIHGWICVEDAVDPVMLLGAWQAARDSLETHHLKGFGKGGHGNAAIMDELTIEVLSACRAEDDRSWFCQHDVDDSNLRCPGLVHRGKRCVANPT